jgi:N-acetylmuramoyl-L-alanine amidase
MRASLVLEGRDRHQSASIGIEIVNPGHEFGYRPFPDAQIDALIALVADIRTRWSIDDARILGHSDVAPARKQDPGELFPWKRWRRPGTGSGSNRGRSPRSGDPLVEGDEGVGVIALQAGLTRLGYDCARQALFDEATREIVEAFQRHWRADAGDGVADGETRATLMGVLRAAG